LLRMKRAKEQRLAASIDDDDDWLTDWLND
jgi:hypothetical protein